MFVSTRNALRIAILCFVVGVAPTAMAIDPWDVSGTGDDDDAGTDNELVHGSEQLHDLQAVAGVQDQDWFRLGQAPFSSYEVLVDGLTESVATIPPVLPTGALQVDEVTSTGTLLASGESVSTVGAARSLRLRNLANAEVITYVRIRTGTTGGCTTDCTSTAQYRIRMRETTLMIPRFNNAGTQITVLIMQNSSRSPVAATARFWSLAGSLIASHPFTIPSRGGYVVNTATVAGASGVSGVMTVEHDGRFGEVTGKSVALEPSTGFSFDTPAVPRFQ